MTASKNVARIGRQEPRIRVEPEWSYTDGGDAAEFAAAYGLAPDEWQQMVLDSWLCRDLQDKYLCTSCGLSVSRQNGKNAIIEMRELYGMCVVGEKILHTAHEVKTARKAFLRLCSFFENERLYPELAAMVLSIRKTNGQEAIFLKNGADIEFSARSKTASRGFTKDVVVFDESQELTEEQMEAILSTMAAAPLGNRQLIFTGTPPPPSSPGEVFRRVRKDALANSDKNLCWHEWSVDRIGDIADRDRWYETNPAMGIRLDEGFTETEMRRLSEDGFARERLGWWSSESSRAEISKEEWESLSTDEPPKEGKLAYGVKFSPDGSTVALCVALKPKEGNPHIEVIDQRMTRGGISWLSDWLVERKDRAAVIVVDGKSHVDSLCPELRDRGVPKLEICIPAVGEVIASSTRTLSAIREKKVTHFSQPQLDSAATAVEKRLIGKSGGFGWRGIGGADPTPFEAACLAYWGVMTTKRDPARKQRIL